MEKYRPHRYPTQFPTVATIGPNRVSVRIVDVNSKGMRVETSTKVIAGTPIHLDVLDTKVRGTVRWCHRGFVGVSFMPELLERQVDTLRFAARGGQSARYSSVGLREMR